MSSKDLVTRYNNQKEKIKLLKTKQERLLGRFDQLTQNLSEIGFEDVADAELALEGWKEKYANLLREIKEKLDEIDEILESVGNN